MRKSTDGGGRCSKSPDVLTIIDLGVANLASLVSALRFLGADIEVTASPDQVGCAQAMVLPGVGAFDTAVHRLDALDLRRPLLERIADGVPTLGICLGMQLLFAASEEGERPGLGLFSEGVVRLGRDPSSKVPHVGFDRVRTDPGTWLRSALGETPDFYFTHSFGVVEAALGAQIGRCDYDLGFVAAIERWPIVGAQFHPEKSQSSGLAFLLAFLRRASEER